MDLYETPDGAEVAAAEHLAISRFYAGAAFQGDPEATSKCLMHTRFARTLLKVPSMESVANLTLTVDVLLNRFQHDGNPEDLKEATLASEELVRHCEQANQSWFRAFHCLGRCLGRSFGLTKSIEDLRRACEAFASATAACRTEAPADLLPSVLGSQAHWLSKLYEVTEEREALEVATLLAEEAVSLTPFDSHFASEIRSTLATLLCENYRIEPTNIAALDRAFELASGVVDASEVDTAKLPTYLHTLSFVLLERFRLSQDAVLLQDAALLMLRVWEICGSEKIEVESISLFAGLMLELAVLQNSVLLFEQAQSALKFAIEREPTGSVQLALLADNLLLMEATAVVMGQDPLPGPDRIAHFRSVLEGCRESPRFLVVISLGLVTLLMQQAEPDYFEVQAILDDLKSDDPGLEIEIWQARAALYAVSQGSEVEAHAKAWEIVRGELETAGNDSETLWYLSARRDGILSDYIYCLVVSGFADEARNLLGQGDLQTVNRLSANETLVWAVTASLGTVVFFDQGNDFECVSITRSDIRKSLGKLFGKGIDDQPDFGAVDVLLAQASQVAQLFPSSTRLKVVTLGMSSALPFNGAKTTKGDWLIDSTDLVLAPYAFLRQPSSRSTLFLDRVKAIVSEDTGLNFEDDRDTITNCFPAAVFTDGYDTVPSILASIASEVDLVHFSCHASWNPQTPLDSCLFTPQEMTMKQIYGSRTEASLVNLSACETSYLSVRRSDHSPSIATAFLAAGARYVAATSWPVDGLCASKFNLLCYKLLAKGMGIVEAHSSAVRSLRHIVESDKDSDYRHPYYWVAFQLLTHLR
jgi:CHAT domain